MRRQEIWVLDGYATATAANYLFDVPVLEQNRKRQISPELTKRKLYAGFCAPGVVLDRLYVEFTFRRKGEDVAKIPFYLRGAATAGTSPAVPNRPEFAPALPFIVRPGTTFFNYPPDGAPDARSFQVFDLAGVPSTCENLLMFPTPLNIEADEVECTGGISVESTNANALRLIWGIVSEQP